MKAFWMFTKQFFSFSGTGMYWNIVGMGFISFFEGIAIFLFIPMLAASEFIEMNRGDARIHDLFLFYKKIPDPFSLPIILGIYVFLFFIQYLIDQKLVIRNAKYSQAFVGRLRMDTYQKLLQADWGFFTKRRKSDLINIMTIELARVAGGLNQLLQLLSGAVFTVIQIAIAFWLSAEMTVFVLLSGLALSVFSRKYIRRSQELGKKTSKLAQEYLAGITDQLNGIKEIKTNSMERTRLKWLDSVVSGMFSEQMEYIKLKTSSQLFYKISATILIAVFIFISANIFSTEPAQFLLILMIFSRLWPRITAIQSSMEQLAAAVPAFNGLLKLQNECSEAIEMTKKSESFPSKPLTSLNNIACRDVSFRYNPDELTYALKNINIKIHANEMTAIVGCSGAGKSTLIDVLIGMNKPEQGIVLVNDLPLTSEYLVAYRNAISYVPQDPYLFNTTIKENIVLSARNVSDDEIWEALESAAAADFIRKLPEGLDTLVGDRGIRLSGGERQRLVLARALLRKPLVLILDEATSSLDYENEAKIQESLEKLYGKLTIVVIAHRLSTIRHADQVIVLEQGRVVQTGGFKQLSSEKEGAFHQLLDHYVAKSS